MTKNPAALLPPPGNHSGLFPHFTYRRPGGKAAGVTSSAEVGAAMRSSSAEKPGQTGLLQIVYRGRGLYAT